MKPSIKIPLHNGSLECSLREYVLFDGKYSDFRAEGGSVSNPEARKEQGPKKVRHISDDDWEKQAKKFNSGKGMTDDRKKKKTFNRDDKKRSFDSTPKGRFSRDDDDDDFDNYRSGSDNFKQNRSYDREGRNDRGGKGFDRNDRGERKPFRGDRNDRPFNRDNRGGNNKSNRSFDKGDKKFDRDRKPQENRGYNPANSRGPRLPQSSETIINPVHMRQRKGWKKNEEED